MSLQKLANGKVELFDTATGQRVERWPVDARDMLLLGGWSLTVPTDDVAVESNEANAEPTETAAEMIARQVSPTGAPLVVSREASPAEALTVETPVRAPSNRQAGRK